MESINIEELEKKRDSMAKEVLASIKRVPSNELLNSAVRELEMLASSHKVSVEKLFSMAESNELPFSLSSLVFNLVLKIRAFKEA
jgi:hypothetical protein